MRRLLFIVWALVTAMCLGSCGFVKQSEMTGLPLDSFVLEITVQGKGVYGVHIEYLIGGEPMGGRFMGYADNSEIRKGEVFHDEYLKGDFKEGSDISEMEIFVFAVTEDQSELSAGEKIPVKAALNTKQALILSGDPEQGFTAQLTDR
ncbi:MAG: hypothetical protein GX061_06930 [Eubacteriaceae bacterium]|nr:hypothetical protein [Eubacteriaceae bacterium]